MKLKAEDFDPFVFIQRLQIIGKDGKRVRLNLTAEQIDILQSLVSGEDTLILKPRQIGSSTIVAAFLCWLWYTSEEPITIAIISYKLKSSKHLLNMVKQMYSTLPKPLHRELEVENNIELSFEDTGARIIAESAGAEGGIRSFTCSYAWISEFGFSPDPEELLATATSALNDGQLIIESTANHYGDALHKEVVKAQLGQSSWNFLFFPWSRHEEYSDNTWTDFELNDTERELHYSLKLSMDQLWWRRKKIQKLGRAKFQREYPLSVEEAYTLTGDTYFTEEDMQYLEKLEVDDVELNLLQRPSNDDAYAIGVDVSGGIGKDYSVIYVLSKMHMQPVAIYRSNTVSPVNLAHKVQELAVKYNRALVLVESNSMGGVVLNELRHLGYSNIWKDPATNKDWYTSRRTKTLMFETLKKTIANGAIRNLDPIAIVELRALTVDDNHNIVLPENLDSHADNAVALALANMCLLHVRLDSNGYLPDWLKRKKAAKIRGTGGAGVKSNRRY